MPSLPFEHLNLRRNPFGERTVEERSQLAIVELQSSITHLQQPCADRRAVLQVIGEKGYGKTTHLLALKRIFPNAEYIHIPEGEYATIPVEGEPLFIDEAQRLSAWQRLQLFRSRRRLVLGTHRDFTRHLRLAGRLVLTLNADRHTNPERIEQILNERIESVRRDSGPIPRVTRTTVDALFAVFGHDLRSMEHHLYDVFQQLRSVQDV